MEVPYKFTTHVQVVPDALPHSFKEFRKTLIWGREGQGQGKTLVARRPFDRMPGKRPWGGAITRESTMYRLITAGCVLALGLLTPVLPAEDKAADNPAARKLNRDIPRHKDFLKRIEASKGAGDVIFLGDSITNGWEARRPGRNTSAPSSR